MKEKTNERNPWKLVSIVFIILFISIIAWGIIDVNSRPLFDPTTDNQVDMAKAIVAQDLISKGDNIGNYDVSVTKRIVGFINGHNMPDGMPCMRHMEPSDGGCNFRSSIQVSLRGSNSGHLYIIESESGKILMHSFTEYPNN